MTISECLPHEAPMLLLDAIKEQGKNYVVASIELAADAPQVVEGEIPMAWALEMMAQAAAVWISGQRSKQGFRQGRLIKVASFKAFQATMPVDQTMLARVENQWASDTGVFTFSGSMTLDGAQIADADFTLLAQ